MYTGISLAYELPKAEVIEKLKQNRENLILESQAVKTGMNVKEKALQGEIPRLTKIVFEHMFNVIEEQIRLIDATINALDKK